MYVQQIINQKEFTKISFMKESDGQKINYPRSWT